MVKVLYLSLLHSNLLQLGFKLLYFIFQLNLFIFLPSHNKDSDCYTYSTHTCLSNIFSKSLILSAFWSTSSCKLSRSLSRFVSTNWSCVNCSFCPLLPRCTSAVEIHCYIIVYKLHNSYSPNFAWSDVTCAWASWALVECIWIPLWCCSFCNSCVSTNPWLSPSWMFKLCEFVLPAVVSLCSCICLLLLHCWSGRLCWILVHLQVVVSFPSVSWSFLVVYDSLLPTIVDNV